MAIHPSMIPKDDPNDRQMRGDFMRNLPSYKSLGGAFPAFPSHGTMGEVVQLGMTLRDYFAAKAMAALLSYDGWHAAYSEKVPDGDVDFWEGTAYQSYVVADMMLKERGAE